MGIGLGIDYVTWWEILKWIPPTSKLHCAGDPFWDFPPCDIVNS